MTLRKKFAVGIQLSSFSDISFSILQGCDVCLYLLYVFFLKVEGSLEVLYITCRSRSVQISVTANDLKLLKYSCKLVSYFIERTLFANVEEVFVIMLFSCLKCVVFFHLSNERPFPLF